MGRAWADDWCDPAPVLVAESYMPELPDPLRTMLWRRDYRTNEQAAAFLDPHAFRLPDVPLQPDLPLAVDRLLQALAHREDVAIWGDYDVDGQTATAVLVGALRRAGMPVRFHIPPCTDEHRGLTPHGLELLAAQGTKLLVTCDCGTNDVESVAYARSLGMDVIVTDHHTQTAPPPAAAAVLNPGHLHADDPLYGLSGVGVAYLLARGVLRRSGAARDANEWLDLVALGTVADVTATSPAVRALLARGLPRLWQRPRPGVRALLEVTGKRPHSLDTEAISFGLGPLLNAAGRLGAQRECVELLLSDDPDHARSIARHLRGLQEQRNALAAEIEAAATRQVEDGAETGPALAVGRDWPQSVLGRVAGAMAHRYNRPSIIISIPSDGGPARGSARATGAVDLCALLARHQHALMSFGGHAHAAGFSLQPDMVPALCDDLRAALSSAPRQPSLCVDAPLDWAAIARPGGALDLLRLVQRLAPYCNGNPEPLFASYGLRVCAQRRFGADNQHLLLALTDASGHRHDVKWWRAGDGWQHEGPVDVAYAVAPDGWRPHALQVTLRGIRPHRRPV